MPLVAAVETRNRTAAANAPRAAADRQLTERNMPASFPAPDPALIQPGGLIRPEGGARFELAPAANRQPLSRQPLVGAMDSTLQLHASLPRTPVYQCIRIHCYTAAI